MSTPGILSRAVVVARELPASAVNRIVGAVLALPTGIVLGLAMYLTPDPAGFGTHRQLGLSGCVLLTWTGWPCPMCGMTTTFSHLAHLQLVEGVINQPFGLVLFTGTALTFAVGASDLVIGAGRWRQALAWLERRESSVALFLVVGLLVGWTYKILLMKNFFPWSP